MLVKLEINRENLKRNLEKIRSINKNIICVIKDNAYGLRIENIFPILLENNCNYFAVAYIEEVIKIREILKKLVGAVRPLSRTRPACMMSSKILIFGGLYMAVSGKGRRWLM